MYSDAVPAEMRDRAIAQVKAAGKRGLRFKIGSESRTLMLLVEDGEIYQEVSNDGREYVFTHPDVVD